MSTAVILAGGASRRMGRDKTRLPFGGTTLLDSAVRRFSAVFDHVLVSAADRDKYPEHAGRLVEDLYPGCGPLAGLHAALRRTQEDGVFLVAADMPYADPRAALKLMRLARDGEVCALTVRGRPEPLFAWYSRGILPKVEECLKSGQYGMYKILDHCRVTEIAPEKLGPLWSERLLMNVNYPEDYERLTLQSDTNVL